MFNCYITPHPPIIVKEIGGSETLKVSNTINAMEKIADEIAEIKPETIIVISPHGIVFSDACSIFVNKMLYGDFADFGCHDLSYNLNNDNELASEIVKNCKESDIPLAVMDTAFKKRFSVKNDIDYGMLVPLSFITKKYSNFKLVPINYGFLSNIKLYKFGCAIEKSIRSISEKNKKVVIIASGDLSHKLLDSGPYNYSEYGPLYDKKIVEVIGTGKPENILMFDMKLAEAAGECGLKSFMIMAGVLSQYKTKSEVLSYEGPFGVGYCVARYRALEYNPADLIPELEKYNKSMLPKINDKYVKLAKESLEYFIKTGSYIDKSSIPDEFLDIQRPVFVTLKKAGQLRGCIGATSSQYSNIGEEIVHFAVEAATGDPRFNSVAESELDELEYSVDELFPLEAVNDVNELDPKEYGVVVSKGYKQGLLLPNLEGVDTVERQIEIAAEKAGINHFEGSSLQKFRVIRHKCAKKYE